MADGRPPFAPSLARGASTKAKGANFKAKDASFKAKGASAKATGASTMAVLEGIDKLSPNGLAAHEFRSDNVIPEQDTREMPDEPKSISPVSRGWPPPCTGNGRR